MRLGCRDDGFRMLGTSEEALVLLRSALPWWGAQGLWGPALLATASCALLGSWAAIQVASAPLRSLPDDAPWYERARLAQPAQVVSLLGLVLPAVAFGVLVTLERGPLVTLPIGWAVAGIVAVALMASAWPRQLLRQLQGRPRQSALGVLRDDAVGLLLMAPQLGIVIALAVGLRAPFDALDALMLAGALGASAVTAVHAGLPLLRWLGAVHPAPERLRAIVSTAAQRLGVPLARVEIVDWSIANAFALPLSRRLVFTARCCELLDDAQLTAIAAHELGHLSEPASARAARFLSGFVLLPLGAAPLLIDAFGPWGLMAPLVLLLMAVLGLQRLTRQLEERADGVARGDELAPGVYARALEALYRDNGVPMVGSRKRTPHPHLYDRLLSAGVTPEHARPAPPSQARKLAGAAVATALTLPVAIFLMLAPLSAHFETDPGARVTAMKRLVALRSGRDNLLALAMALEEHGDAGPALAVTRAAVALDPADFMAPAFEATLHSRRHECGLAEAALAAARARARAADAHFDDAWMISAETWVASCRGTTATARRS